MSGRFGPPTVALLTDFGSSDGYVGAMKGAMLAIEPRLRFIDVAHGIPRGDAAAAAWVLRQSAPHFPTSCVQLAVVDPGVGSARRALAVQIAERFFVAPDNGLLTWVAEGAVSRCVELAGDFAPVGASPLFHGRDVFGPAAVHLATGGALGELGRALDPAELVRLPFAAARTTGAVWSGTVVYVDHFGNLITNLPLPVAPEDAVPLEGVVEITGRNVPLRRTYADVATGELVALRGSSGTLEVSVNGSSAAAALGISTGDVVTFRAY